MTRVVNLRVHPYDVYIGRAGQGTGYYGNPIRRGHECPVCGAVHQAPGRTIACFRVYFEYRMAHDPEFNARVLSLKGKVLGCFCKPGPCHGDVYAEYLNA